MDANFELHPSRLSAWSRCEKRALAEATAVSQPQPEHIASWIGRAVHAEAAGAEWPDMPDETVRFDRVTPSLDMAGKQARRLGSAAKEGIARQGFDIVGQEELHATRFDFLPWLEVVGTMDMRILVGEAYGIIDLKTGRSLEGAWLQVGAYALMTETPAEWVGILHVPRHWARHYEIPEPLLLLKPTDRILPLVERNILRIGEVLVGGDEVAVTAPGAWCAHCPIGDCAARVQEHEGNEQ